MIGLHHFKDMMGLTPLEKERASFEENAHIKVGIFLLSTVMQRIGTLKNGPDVDWVGLDSRSITISTEAPDQPY